MGRKRRSPKPDCSLPVLAAGRPRTARRRRFARWRAVSLSLVYVVFAIHIIHWKLSGRTLAPLELNEVMYTLELGIITAGFLFMGALVLGTLIFGRFFCSWACHIMVLQDLCAWLLRKCGIRRKPIRSRLLLLVPPLTASYMFIWPQLLRAWESRAIPTFHLRADTEGWASFVTENFWRNLPGPWIIALTFLVCGFAIVYLMGSRTFCTYVCPYGAVFALADRFSPGRIVVSDKCRQCATCTAACTCGVRVHDEVKAHKMIANPACLKCLDCVAACPEGALRYTFTAPALFKSRRTGGRFGRIPYDYSRLEELILALVFLVSVLSFRGLYSRVPFLLSLAMGVILGFLTVAALRLISQSEVTFSTIPLKTAKRVTPAGRAFALAVIALLGFLAHSAFVRYHEYTGLRQARALRPLSDPEVRQARAATARGHLITADRWGLIRNPRVERSLLTAAAYLDDAATIESMASRVLRRDPCDSRTRLLLARWFARAERHRDAEREYREIVSGACAGPAAPVPDLVSAHQELGDLLAQRQEFAAAAEHLGRAVVLDPDRAEAWATYGGFLAELGRLDEAIQALQTGVRLDPTLAKAEYNLGTILAHFGRFEAAVASYERAAAAGLEDAELHNNMGFAYWRLGRLGAAGDHLQRALALDADNADAHFNLGRLLSAKGELDDAATHLEAAARLEPRYASLLRSGS
jgi:tetratricopeptide (TPR) repeat protein/polyferredoxin